MKKNSLLGIFAWIAILTILVFPISIGFADVSEGADNSQLRKMESQIQNLQDIISKQNNEIQNIKSSMKSPAAERVATVAQVPPPIDKEDFLAASKEAYPWIYGLKQGGDFRIRYEAFDTSDCDPDTTGVTTKKGATTTNLSCNRSRNRFRVRLRYGFEKKLNDEWTVGFRLATGSTTDPTSTNQTLTGYFTYKTVVLDQIYAIYTPNLLKNLGPLEGVELGVGKFKNPFEKYSSKMVFDRDVTPEGLYEKSTVNLWNSEMNKVKWDLTGGQFVTNENSGKQTDSEMFGVQTGLDISTFAFHTERAVESRTGFSFYTYPGFSETIANNTAGQNFLNGNSSDMKHVRVVDLYQEVKAYPFGTPSIFWGEIVHNLSSESPSSEGFKNKANRLDPRDDYGFAIGTTIGEAKTKGGWDIYCNYMYIGANSEAAVFSDSDFGNGFTNGKGWNFGLEYGLTDFLTLAWNNWVVQPVEPRDDAAASSDRVSQTIYRTQLDLVWKF